MENEQNTSKNSNSNTLPMPNLDVEAEAGAKAALEVKSEPEKWSPRAKKTAKVIFLSISMFFIAGVSENLGKEILNHFKYPLTLSFVHLFSSSIYAIPLLWFMGLKNFPVNRRQFLRVVLPMAIIKSFSVAAGHLSIAKISVAYAQIIKACLPIFTVVFGLLFFKFRSSKRVFFSLVVMVTGIVIASFTEAKFSGFGLALGLASTMGQSIQHIVNNRLMNESKIHSFELLAFYARFALLIFTPVWFLSDAEKVFNFFKTSSDSFSSLQIPLFLLADGFLNFLENIFAFLLLKVVTAPSYAVVGASKRVIAILISFIWFKLKVTLANSLGIATAVFGVFLYSYFRFKDNGNTLVAQSTSSDVENTNTNTNTSENPEEINEINPEENVILINGKNFKGEKSNSTTEKENPGIGILFSVLETI